jgi:hypothetical protein
MVLADSKSAAGCWALAWAPSTADIAAHHSSRFLLSLRPVVILVTILIFPLKFFMLAPGPCRLKSALLGDFELVLA